MKKTIGSYEETLETVRAISEGRAPAKPLRCAPHRPFELKPVGNTLNLERAGCAHDWNVAINGVSCHRCGLFIADADEPPGAPVSSMTVDATQSLSEMGGV